MSKLNTLKYISINKLYLDNYWFTALNRLKRMKLKKTIPLDFSFVYQKTDSYLYQCYLNRNLKFIDTTTKEFSEEILPEIMKWSVDNGYFTDTQFYFRVIKGLEDKNRTNGDSFYTNGERLCCYKSYELAIKDDDQNYGPIFEADYFRYHMTQKLIKDLPRNVYILSSEDVIYYAIELYILKETDYHGYLTKQAEQEVIPNNPCDRKEITIGKLLPEYHKLLRNNRLMKNR